MHHEAPGGPRRHQEAPGGPRRHQEAPGGPRRPQEAPGGPRRLQEAPGGIRRPQEAPGGPRRHQEAPGGTRRPLAEEYLAQIVPKIVSLHIGTSNKLTFSEAWPRNHPRPALKNLWLRLDPKLLVYILEHIIN